MTAEGLRDGTTRVTVRPFLHRRDGDDVIIGDLDRQVFLAVPPEGLDILQWLAAGHTVEETVERYRERHGETPDIEDFLDGLRAEGFVGQPGEVPEVPGPAEVPGRRRRRSVSLDWIPQRVAARLVSAPVLVACGLLAALGVTITIVDHHAAPTPYSLLFPVNFTVLTWLTVAVALITVTLHELSHAVAARAVGVPVRMGIGNQLYFPVAQTDISGIWLAPRRFRVRAYLIGTLVDLVGYAFFAIALYAGDRGWMGLSRNAVLLIQAVMFTYCTRILWQCLFFMRTDGYYAVSTALGCRSLLTDTEDYLYNKLAVLRRDRRRVDQSAIPAREMCVVRLFTPVWLVGRVFAVFLLVAFGLPVWWGYFYQVLLLVTGQHSRFTTTDFATVAGLPLLAHGSGLTLWVRSLYRRARQRYQARRVVRGTDLAVETVAGAREPGLA